MKTRIPLAGRCLGTQTMAMSKDACPSRSDWPSVRSSHRHCPGRVPKPQGQTMDLSLRMRQANERPEHDAYLRSYPFLRMSSEGICRSDRANLRRLDCAGTQSRGAAPDTLVLPMCMRHRAVGFRLQSYRWHSHTLHPQAKSLGPHIRKMDGCRERQASPLLALSLRVRHRTGRDWIEPEYRYFRVMWLHDWASEQRASTSAWSGKQQDILGLDLDASEMPEPEQQGVFQLWRPRHPSLTILEHLRRLRARHGAYLRRRVDARTHQREWQLLSRQLHVDTAIHAISKQTPLFRMEAP
jgi:hypothetical protein